MHPGDGEGQGLAWADEGSADGPGKFHGVGLKRRRRWRPITSSADPTYEAGSADIIYRVASAPSEAFELAALSSSPNDFSAICVSSVTNIPTCSRLVSTWLSFGQRPWR
jgi:hypothetical protein